MATSVSAVAKQIKDLEKSVSAIATSTSRLDQFNEMLAKQRDDFNKALIEIEKKHQKETREATKRHLEELEPVQKEMEKFKKAVTPEIASLKSEIKVRASDQVRLNDAVALVKPQIDEVLRVHEEVKTSQKILEENRRLDIKRVADLQGELAAMRKRIDDARAKADMSADSLRNMDNRINELLLSESERKSAQTAFIEQQSLAQIDREHVVKDWQVKFEEFKQVGKSLDGQIALLDETLRSAKKSQETYNELNTRLERRINEISEMQRLAEDRVRQEWVSFKADDQKRWTGYSLSQEESMRDLRKDMDRFEGRVAALDDSAQVLQDQLHQTADATEQQLQEFMNVAHAWLTAYERIMGHAKKTTKKTAK
jgi:DNA repair exonuclease SbcCD ATPase subunit